VLWLGEQLGVPWTTPRMTITPCARRSRSRTTPTVTVVRKATVNAGAACSAHPRQTVWTSHPGASATAHLLTNARHVLAPSRDTARRYARRWPAADVRLAPHTDLAALRVFAGSRRGAAGPGCAAEGRRDRALSRIKGADLLEDVAVLAAKGAAPVEFHLLGYAYRELRKQPRASLTVHGPYQEDDLPGLLRWIKPDLVWFPALWPETYSYTLSACLTAACRWWHPISILPREVEWAPVELVVPWTCQPETGWPSSPKCERQTSRLGWRPPPWADFASSVDDRIGSWSYDTDYLLQVVPRWHLLRRIPNCWLRSERPKAKGGAAAPKAQALDAECPGQVACCSSPQERGTGHPAQVADPGQELAARLA